MSPLEVGELGDSRDHQEQSHILSIPYYYSIAFTNIRLLEAWWQEGRHKDEKELVPVLKRVYNLAG